jgi:lipoprotein signal peptidase
LDFWWRPFLGKNL